VIKLLKKQEGAACRMTGGESRPVVIYIIFSFFKITYYMQDQEQPQEARYLLTEQVYSKATIARRPDSQPMAGRERDAGVQLDEAQELLQRIWRCDQKLVNRTGSGVCENQKTTV